MSAEEINEHINRPLLFIGAPIEVRKRRYASWESKKALGEGPADLGLGGGPQDGEEFRPRQKCCQPHRHVPSAVTRGPCLLDYSAAPVSSVFVVDPGDLRFHLAGGPQPRDPTVRGRGACHRPGRRALDSSLEIRKQLPPGRAPPSQTRHHRNKECFLLEHLDLFLNLWSSGGEHQRHIAKLFSAQYLSVRIMGQMGSICLRFIYTSVIRMASCPSPEGDRMSKKPSRFFWRLWV